MLYNMRYATGAGFKFHLPFPFGGFFRKTNKNLQSLIEFFRNQKADVLGLVEIDAGSYRAGYRSQADTIGEHLSHRAFCKTKYAKRSFWRRLPVMGKQANAILADAPVIREKTHFLSKGVKRLVMELELEDVTIFIVHLALSRRGRAAQLADLEQLLKNVSKPYILAGDFNAFAGKIELEDFMQALGLSSANTADAPTFPCRSPRWQLDFILHSPEVKISHFEVAKGIHLSDHLPLICDFEVIKPAAALTA